MNFKDYKYNKLFDSFFSPIIMFCIAINILMKQFYSETVLIEIFLGIFYMYLFIKAFLFISFKIKKRKNIELLIVQNTFDEFSKSETIKNIEKRYGSIIILFLIIVVGLMFGFDENNIIVRILLSIFSVILIIYSVYNFISVINHFHKTNNN